MRAVSPHVIVMSHRLVVDIDFDSSELSSTAATFRPRHESDGDAAGFRGGIHGHITGFDPGPTTTVVLPTAPAVDVTFLIESVGAEARIRIVAAAPTCGVVAHPRAEICVVRIRFHRQESVFS